MITRRGRFVGHLFAFLFCLWGGAQTIDKSLTEAVVLSILVMATGLAISLTVEFKWNEAELVRSNRRARRTISEFESFQRRVVRQPKCHACGSELKKEG